MFNIEKKKKSGGETASLFPWCLVNREWSHFSYLVNLNFLKWHILTQGTVMQIEKALINYHLRVSKVS